MLVSQFYGICAMRNVTILIDEATYHKPRVMAARRRTSLSALVREYLRDLDEAADTLVSIGKSCGRR
jgi:hypothetical protein